MNKQELTNLVAEILSSMNHGEPMVKGSDYKTLVISPDREANSIGQDQAEDVTAMNLRKLYLTENPENPEKFLRMKQKTPARLGSGKAGARYKTVTMLRFRADHAAAQDAVFSQVPEEFARKQGMIPLQTRCEDKDMYLTRPDLGRIFDEKNQQILKERVPKNVTVQIVVGDGLSSAAVMENAPECLAAIRDGLKLPGIETGPDLFVRYCRVGAGDAIGEITHCDLVCMLVGERPGLVTDKSMSAYLTYMPRKGVSESSRTVVSNIHAQGTPAAEAGAYIAELMEKILKNKVSGVGLHTREGA